MPSSSSAEPPGEVTNLADRRAVARVDRDFPNADSLRAEIAALGWVVRDVPEGYTLEPKPAYDVLPSVVALPDNARRPDERRCTVALLVEGWPDDLRECVAALLRHGPPDVVVSGLDMGNVDGAGDVLHELAQVHPGRVEEWHVERPAGWAQARTALLRADVATIHVWLDLSTILEGDGLTPVLAAFDEDPAVVGAGWRGVDVDAEDGWRSFVPAVPGDVDAILGYLFAMRRQAAIDAGGPHPKARFYRNADIEFSFALREAGLSAGRSRLVVPAGELPIRQGRHRGYFDSEPAFRDRESRRTYDRFLQRFRGRTELLASRGR